MRRGIRSPLLPATSSGVHVHVRDTSSNTFSLVRLVVRRPRASLTTSSDAAMRRQILRPPSRSAPNKRLTRVVTSPRKQRQLWRGSPLRGANRRARGQGYERCKVGTRPRNCDFQGGLSFVVDGGRFRRSRHHVRSARLRGYATDDRQWHGRLLDGSCDQPDRLHRGVRRDRGDLHEHRRRRGERGRLWRVPRLGHLGQRGDPDHDHARHQDLRRRHRHPGAHLHDPHGGSRCEWIDDVDHRDELRQLPDVVGDCRACR